MVARSHYIDRERYGDAATAAQQRKDIASYLDVGCKVLSGGRSYSICQKEGNKVGAHGGPLNLRTSSGI